VNVLRTPDERFTDLPDFAYPPQYAEVGDALRIAWVEDGPADAPAVVLLHGEPSWSFLYRRMIPVLAAAGLRVIAPDLIGFGRSDKPAEAADHSYATHVEWTRQLVFDVLDLRDVTLVGQDWGGLIGLRLAAEHPDRFRQTVGRAAELDIGRLVASGCVRGLDERSRAAYDAPFPDESFKAGPRAMPELVPYRPDNPASAANRAAWSTLAASRTPMLVAFSDSDPITAAMGPILQRAMAGAAGREHPLIANAGHFLQEDAGPELADAVVRFVRSTS
jgi:haloalkane dehalogenase